MSYTYIKFEVPNSRISGEKDNVAKKIAKKVIKTTLSAVFPVANPHFDKQIENVKEWYLEYDNENNFTNREIGFDFLGNPIVIMPWKNNYGYWIDIDVELEYFFSNFNAKVIDKSEFDHSWKGFEDQH